MPRLDVLGITRLGDLTGLDRIGIPVVQAVRPLELANSVTQGKRRARAAATVIAQAQRARSLQLHAATSKARLLPSFEQRQAALACLDIVHAPFSGGFETQDLQDAGQLPEEVR
jgi:hypothetical protein